MDVTFFTEDDTDKIVLLYILTGTAADITMVRRRIAGPTNMRVWSMFNPNYHCQLPRAQKGSDFFWSLIIFPLLYNWDSCPRKTIP